MAAWQVDFFLVPRRVITAPADLSPRALRETDWWRGVPFPSDYRKRLAIVASAPMAEGGNPEMWGREDSDRVDVWSDGGRVIRATVRVDVRRLDSRFGAALIGFVRAAGAVFVRSDGLIVEPIIAAYAGALRNSDAWKFANPATISAPLSDPDADE